MRSLLRPERTGPVAAATSERGVQPFRARSVGLGSCQVSSKRCREDGGPIANGARRAARSLRLPAEGAGRTTDASRDSVAHPASSVYHDAAPMATGKGPIRRGNTHARSAYPIGSMELLDEAITSAGSSDKMP